MLEPKEKAKELLWKYLPILEGWKFEDSNLAKQCALIAVNEIIKECYRWTGGDNGEWDNKRFEYWEEVKQEINKL